MNTDGGSPFLAIPESEWAGSNDLAFAIRDGYPVSPGHTLVVPRRLIPEWDSATTQEQQAILALVDKVKADLRRTHAPDGFNIGVNVGRAAGAGIPTHIHWHIVPRWDGDHNFMPVLSDTRILPEALEALYQKLIAAQTKLAGA